MKIIRWIRQVFVVKMKIKRKVSYIYLVDCHRILTDEMDDRFRNYLKYSLKHFSSAEAFLTEFKELSLSRNQTRITIYVDTHINESADGEKHIKKFVETLKELDPGMNILLVSTQKEGEGMRKIKIPASFTIIQNNENTMLILTNYIMGVISGENLERKYLASRLLIIVFLLFILASLLFAAISYFLLPQYF